MRNTTLAGNQPNDPVLQNKFLHQGKYLPKLGNERLQLNDCLLRNVQKYKYIACIDIDEIIVKPRPKTQTPQAQPQPSQTQSNQFQGDWGWH